MRFSGGRWDRHVFLAVSYIRLDGYDERMKKRFSGAEKALGKLHEGVIKDSLTEMERDGLIQRFEFAFEIMWK